MLDCHVPGRIELAYPLQEFAVLFQVGHRQTIRTISSCLHFGQPSKGLLLNRSGKVSKTGTSKDEVELYMSLATQKGISRPGLHTRHKTKLKGFWQRGVIAFAQPDAPFIWEERPRPPEEGRRTGFNTTSDRHDYHKAYCPGIQRTVYWPAHGVSDLKSSMPLLFSSS